MSHKNSRYQSKKMLSRPGDPVKARIVGAGIQLGELAEAARISQPSLSNYLAGKRGSYRTQLRIWEAFRRLSGQRISMQRFWGELLSERIAG